MKPNHKKNFIFALTLALLFLLRPFVSGANAVTTSPIDLSVSPPVNYFSIKPGEVGKYDIKLENLGENALEVTPTLLDFEADDKTGQPVVKSSGTFPYLKLDDGQINFGSNFVLEPRQKMIVSVNIEIPKNANEEEYAMTIFFSFKNQIDPKVPNSQAKITGTVGSNLIVLVTRNNSDRGELRVKNISSLPTIDSFMGIKFGAMAENIGKNATQASGSATLYNWQNKELAKYEIHPDMILSGSSRELREKEFVSNEFRYKKPFLIGLYKIKIELNKNSQVGAEKVTMSRTILALPFSILLLPLIGYLLYSLYRVLLDKTKGVKKVEKK